MVYPECLQLVTFHFDYLSDKLNIDALVLIDTEGLGAPEKMDDPDSEKKDRILATFAMGISNLTILNVLGENARLD